MIPLEQVLRPYNLDKFLQEFWRKQTLHIKRGVEGYYDDLLQPRHVEELLLHGRLRHPDVRVVQHGREDPDEELLNAGWFDKAGSEQSTENLATLYGFYQDGFTLMVEAQRVSSGIFELCRQMEEWLQHPVVAKIFLTPRGSQSFPVHYDTSDSFILQVSGAKRWRLYPISQEKPTTTLSERVRRKAWNVSGAPVFDQTLQPGDLLYIPRLQPHEVVTKTDDSSLHVTIGITPFYWRDLMISSLEELMDRHPRFNETLPAQFFRASTDEVSQTSDQLWVWAQQNADARGAVARLGTKFCAGMRPLAGNQFAQIDSIASLTLDSTLQRKPGMFCHLEPYGSAVKLSFPGQSFDFPNNAVPALETIIAADSFTPRTLAGNLDKAGRLALVRSLLEAGLLRFAPQNSLASIARETS